MLGINNLFWVELLVNCAQDIMKEVSDADYVDVELQNNSSGRDFSSGDLYRRTRSILSTDIWPSLEAFRKNSCLVKIYFSCHIDMTEGARFARNWIEDVVGPYYLFCLCPGPVVTLFKASCFELVPQDSALVRSSAGERISFSL